MKWLPISELSDEQKDGNWWIFARKTHVTQDEYDKSPVHMSLYKFLYDEKVFINDSCEKYDEKHDFYGNENYFLSMPFPEIFIEKTSEQSLNDEIKSVQKFLDNHSPAVHKAYRRLDVLVGKLKKEQEEKK